MFHCGAELADIAGPVVVDDASCCLGRKIAKRLAVFFGRFLEEGLGEERDVFLAQAQRRHGDLDDIQAKVEVVAEFSLRNELREILVGRGHEANVGMDGLVAAYALKGAFANGAKDLHLSVLIDFSDLVEEERASAGLFKATDTSLEGACEGAFFVPKKLTFKEL